MERTPLGALLLGQRAGAREGQTISLIAQRGKHGCRLTAADKDQKIDEEAIASPLLTTQRAATDCVTARCNEWQRR
jgi:hypothetical protein